VSTLAASILTLLLFAWIFWPARNLFSQRAKTRVDYLRERKEAVYDNLRDLNFEYKSGKYPESDFLAQREALESEASSVLAEIDTLEGLANR
jgi:primosomal protein N''